MPPLQSITGDENVMILAPCPGDETQFCAGLIAESCARGRPPFVAILTDGSSSGPGATPAERAADRERATRRAVAALGLPPGRLLMIGLHDGTVPHHGPAFAALVSAVTLVMWARDCNVICVPRQDAPPDRLAAMAIASEVAACSGVAILRAGKTGHRLEVSVHGKRTDEFTNKKAISF